jgi:Fe-S cluster assembly protein SufD
MSSATESRLWFEQLLQQAEGDSDAPGTLAQARQQARQAVHELPIPGRRQEAWRYTSVGEVLAQQFAPASPDLDLELTAEVNDWLLPQTETYRLLFINGHFAPALSNGANLPEGVTLGSLRTALHLDPQTLTIWFGQTANHSQHIFTALNTALMNDGLFIHLRRDVALDRPIEVMHLNLAPEQPLLIQPRNLIVLEAGAKAELIERYRSCGESVYFHNGVSELLLEQGAELAHTRLQEESRQAYHLHESFLAQGADSRYRHNSVSLGGKWSRHDLQARFQAQGADCETHGLYLVGDRQLADQHLDILHNKPRNASRHTYKGIAYGNGKAVFDGRILVDRDAQKTDAHLNNKNLLLSRRAEVDTKPQLEIYADDVQCSHGTSVGQLEPQQLFYLRSRGIDTVNAMKMLCIGFAGEVLESIDNETIRQHAEQGMQAILDHVLDKISEQEHA